MLRLLTGRSERAVTKGELFDRVWPGAVRSDESLTRCVYALRQGLGDARKPHRFIETVHGRGHRFVAAVRPAADRERSSKWLERASEASPRVYEAFLHARSLWHQGSSDDRHRGVTILKQALVWNPRFAAAHSALGACYTMAVWWGQGWPREFASKITAAATRALELDPTTAGAKATLACVRSAIDWQPAEADRLFLDAISSDPTSSLARYRRAIHLLGQARAEEAVESAAAAVRLDPFSLSLNTGLSYSLYLSRRFQRAPKRPPGTWCRRATRRRPARWGAARRRSTGWTWPSSSGAAFSRPCWSIPAWIRCATTRGIVASSRWCGAGPRAKRRGAAVATSSGASASAGRRRPARAGVQPFFGAAGACRKSLGDLPVHRRNARLKLEVSANPSR